jgi:hypothetical protein
MSCINCSSELKYTKEICFDCRKLLIKLNNKSKKEFIKCKCCEKIEYYKYIRDTNCRDCYDNSSDKKCKICRKFKGINEGFCYGCIDNTFICVGCDNRINYLDEKIIKNCNYRYCKSCEILKCSSCLEITEPTSIRFFGDILCDICYSDNSKKSSLEIEMTTKHEDIHNSCSNQKHKCCLCKDIRCCKINVNSYDGYIDDVGFVKNKKRWEHYCPECRVACDLIYNIPYST